MDEDQHDQVDLTEEEFEKLKRRVPGDNLSRYLSRLGRGRELMDVLEDPVGREFLGRVNRKILECENYILSNVNMDGDTDAMKEKKIRFKVYKEEADYILEKVVGYQRDVQHLKRLAVEE